MSRKGCNIQYNLGSIINKISYLYYSKKKFYTKVYDNRINRQKTSKILLSMRRFPLKQYQHIL